MQDLKRYSENTWQDKAISLAGIFHAADMVEHLAKSGYLNTQDFTTSVNSLFEINPDSTEKVYGSALHVNRGLEVLERFLINHRAPENADVLKYVLGMLHLQKKLSANKKMLNTLSTRLETLEGKKQHFESTHDNIVAGIAELYTDTISTFSFRIQVTGEYHYLQQSRVANQIRALLLCGIRSAMLWRQIGGSRIDFFFKRKVVLLETQDLLKRIKPDLT